MSSFHKIYESLKPASKRLINKLSFWFNHSLSLQGVVKKYLKGSGIEIGALHNPLQVPPSVRVQYVDRMPVADLKTHYPELADKNLVSVDIVDDGEHLSNIADASQDFVIAHQFLEHCQNPILALHNMVRVLKQNGILYLSIPDKRYTFDAHRPTTDIDHVLRDYREEPAWSRPQHFYEWAKYCHLGYRHEHEGQDDPSVLSEAKRLMEMDYSIHFHAWTQTEILELLVTLKRSLHFPIEVELFQKNGAEIIVVLSKECGLE